MGVCRTVTVTGVIALGIVGAADAGEIRGSVRLDGARPELALITIEAKSTEHPVEGCGAVTKPSQQLLVDKDGGVQNAVVWVEMPTRPHEPVEEVTRILDQRECVFEPHVILLPVGGTLAIRNSDPMLHNVRIFQERTMLMHEWQQPQGPDLTWRFETPGRYVVRCGVHAWMYAWVVVADHRYHAVTDHGGGFTLPDVPEGSYTLHVWHEAVGEQSQPVTVIPGQSVITVHVAQERGST